MVISYLIVNCLIYVVMLIDMRHARYWSAADLHTKLVF